MSRRFEFHGQTLDEQSRYVSEFVLRKKKDGTFYKRLDWQFRKYCPLLVCECCGAVGWKKRVMHCFESVDPAVLRRKDASTEYFSTLCLSCKNTVQALRRKYIAYDQLRLEANRIRRKLNESTEDNARTA